MRCALKSYSIIAINLENLPFFASFPFSFPFSFLPFSFFFFLDVTFHCTTIFVKLMFIIIIYLFYFVLLLSHFLKKIMSTYFTSFIKQYNIFTLIHINEDIYQDTTHSFLSLPSMTFCDYRFHIYN